MSFLRNILKNRYAVLKGNTFINEHHFISTTPKSAQSFEHHKHGNTSQHFRDERNMPPQRYEMVNQRYKEFIPMHVITGLLNSYLKQGNMSSSQALYLLRHCGEAVPFATLERRQSFTDYSWNAIKKLKVDIDVTHINSLLQAYNDNASTINIDEILQLMNERRITPNRITYSKLIYNYCQKGNIEGANKILEIMNEEKHPIDENVFNALIIGNARANDLDGALQVIDIMKQKELFVNRSTYQCLLQIYSEMNKFEEAKSTVAQAVTDGISISFKSMINAYSNFLANGNEEAADMIYSLLPKEQEQLPTVLVEPITKLVSVGHYEAAFKLITFSRSTPPYLYYFMQQLALTAEVDVIMEYCKKMDKHHLEKNVHGIVIREMARTKSIKRLLDMLNAMEKNQIPISTDMITDVITGLDTNDASFKDNFGKVLQHCNRGIEVDNFIFNYFKYYDTLELLKMMDEQLPKNIYRHQLCFDYLVRQNEFSKALSILLKRGGFRKCNTRNVENLGRSIAKHSDNHEDIGQLFALFHNYCKFEFRRDGFTFAHLIKELDFELEAHNAPNRMEVMEKMLQIVTSYGICVPEGDVTLLIDNCTCLSEDAKKLLNGLIGATPKKPYDDLINRMTEIKKSNFTYSTGGFHNRDKNKMQLFNESYGHRNYGMALDIYERMEGDIPSSVKATAATAYYYKRKLQEVVETISELLSSNYTLTANENMIYTESLISIGRVDDAVKFLQEQTPIELTALVNIRASLLKTIAELSHSETLIIRDILLQKNYLTPLHVLKLDIAIDLFSNNLQAAFEKIKETYITNGNIIWTMEFYKACIETDQRQMLQLMHDFVTEKRGKMDALHSLGFSFLMLKKVKQSLHVFQSLGRQCQVFKFRNIAILLFNEERLEDLENLVKISQDLPDSDKTDFYQMCIKTCIVKNDWAKALDIWTNMQNENLQLSDRFKITFAKFLANNDQEVPFVIPGNFSQANRPEVTAIDKLRSSEISYMDKIKGLVEMESGPNFNVSHAIVYLRELLKLGNASNIYDEITKSYPNVPPFFLKTVLHNIHENKQSGDYLNIVSKHSPLPMLVVGNLVDFCFSSEFLEKAEEVASTVTDNIVNVALWNYYLCAGLNDKAKMELDKCQGHSSLAILNRTFEKCFSDGNHQILHDVIEKMEESDNKDSNFRRFMLIYCSNLCDNGKSEEALQFVKDNARITSTLSTRNKTNLKELFLKFNIETEL